MTTQVQFKRTLLAAAALAGWGASNAALADTPTFEIYGQAQADYIQDFNRVDPDWEDSLRPSKIPTVDGQFGEDGQSVIGVRQSKFGVQVSQDIAGKPAILKFEFDLYGVGDNAGQTTMRLQKFYGSWGPILAGQTETLFMDLDTFPNTIDYWGPPGMVFVRTPQLRFTYAKGPHTLAAAVEKPGNDIDPGNIRLISEDLAASIQGDEKVPDLTAQYRYEGGWGHVQLAGILRQVSFETIGTPNHEPQGHKTGWGLNLASNLKVGSKNTIHLAAVYGEGIASYMNDGGTDLGPTGRVTAPVAGGPRPSDTLAPDVVPLVGLVAYYDHYWNDHWSSSIGWSQTKVDNLSFQADDAFKSGQYASVNLLYTPDKRLMMGAELLWGEREDKDGADGQDARIQFSFRYSFSSNDFR